MPTEVIGIAVGCMGNMIGFRHQHLPSDDAPLMFLITMLWRCIQLRFPSTNTSLGSLVIIENEGLLRNSMSALAGGRARETNKRFNLM